MLAVEAMKTSFTVTEKQQVFSFCGTCGRLLTLTRTNNFVCPRGHGKAQSPYEQKRLHQTDSQIIFGF